MVGVIVNSLEVVVTREGAMNVIVTSVIEIVIGTGVSAVRDEPHHGKGHGHPGGHGHHRLEREAPQDHVGQPGQYQDTWFRYQKYHLIRKYMSILQDNY